MTTMTSSLSFFISVKFDPESLMVICFMLNIKSHMLPTGKTLGKLA